ncbi:hypothetical protein EGW08_014315, partial [Elysia chlorotica]
MRARILRCGCYTILPTAQNQCQNDERTDESSSHYIHHHHHHHETPEQHDGSHRQNNQNIHDIEHSPKPENNHSNEPIPSIREKNLTGFYKTGYISSEIQKMTSPVLSCRSRSRLDSTTLTEQESFVKSSDFGSSAKSSSLALRKLRSVTFVMILTLLSSSFAAVSASMQFAETPENTSKLAGETAILRCRIKDLSGVVQWSKGELLLGRDPMIPYYPRMSMLTGRVDSNGVGTFDLKITNIEASDEAAYMCQVSPTEAYPRGLRSQPAYLSVIVPPDNLTMTHGEVGVEVSLNSPSNVTCTAYRSKPPAEIIFKVNGRRQLSQNYAVADGDLHNTIGILTLNATKDMMSSRVECEVAIPEYNAYAKNPLTVSKILDVLYVPNIRMSTNVTSWEFTESQNVRFHCSGESNPRIVDWRWERNDTIIPGATSDTLVIPSISYDYHNNKISCIASNRVGSSRVDRRLDVKFAARIVHITEVVGADLGRPAEMKCEAVGNPTPIVTWRQKHRAGRLAGGEIPVKTVSVKNVYRIDRVEERNLGWYVCTATVADFPPASAEAMLLRNDKPNLRSEKEQMATEGKAARIECLAHSIPKPDVVTWYGPGGVRINFAMSGRFTEE